MRQINILEVKTHLSALVEKAAAGEPFVITKYGRPLVAVIPYSKVVPNPRTGFLRGQVKVPGDFDRIGSKEVEALFYGS